MPAVGLRREGTDLRGDESQPVAPQVELAGDGWPEPPDRVGDDRDVGARCEFRGVDGAAEPVAALDDEDGAPGPREIGGRGQPVVATAQHDGVVSGARRGRHLRPPGARAP